MSFRKRNIVIRSSKSSVEASHEVHSVHGTRPSPLDGRLLVSSGTGSLDQLISGHGGMPLGTSLLIEESGTTDYGGVILRYFAAEGLVQGHHVHVLGVSDGWRRELPGLAAEKDRSSKQTSRSGPEKMKIAWRYESLASQLTTPEKLAQKSASAASTDFAHSFDLSKRLENNCINGQLITYPLFDGINFQSVSPFVKFIEDLHAYVQRFPRSIHRIVAPHLLSPSIYAPDACKPEHVLRFLHALRSILRQFPTRVIALISLPVSLHPRDSGLCKWMELFSDGVIELIHLGKTSQQPEASDGDNKVQGLVRVHALPIFHEKGGGIEFAWKREDMSFHLSASRGLVITPFTLPPVGVDEPATVSSQPTSENLSF